MMQFFLFIVGGLIMVFCVNMKMKKLFTQSLMFLMSLNLIISGMDKNFFMLISMNMGLDLFSYSLMILVGWILGLMILSLEKEYKINMLMYLMIILMLNMLILFFSMNLLIFYMFFEISLIPMILMIVTWGYSMDRFLSMMYMYFYTLFFSLPLLMFLIFLFKKMSIFDFSILGMLNLNYENSIYLVMLMIFPFLVKLPMYMIHGWLPKAHVEAPLIGSMFLAGILLKLGGYGLIRFLKIFENLILNLSEYLLIFSMIGGMILSIQCLMQVDMKVLVAYSSVVHMSMVLSSLLSMKFYGFKGSMMMMIAHGLCSSAMFYLVNLSYKLTSSRSMLLNKGMINYDSSLSMMWFLICSCNMSIPMSLNLLGEVFMIMGLMSYSMGLMILVVMMLFFSACYTLYLFTYTQYGQMNFEWIKKCSSKIKDYLNLLIHWIPLMLIFLNLIYMF